MCLEEARTAEEERKEQTSVNRKMGEKGSEVLLFLGERRND